MIVQEMLCDINKYFHNDNNIYATQQLIGHKDLFREVIVKEWAIINQNRTNFHSHDE